MIGDSWESYRKDVIPSNASEIQVKESRRAFYAGAQALLSSILGILDPGEEDTEKDLLAMDAIDMELKDFQRQVSEGKA